MFVGDRVKLSVSETSTNEKGETTEKNHEKTLTLSEALNKGNKGGNGLKLGTANNDKNGQQPLQAQ